MTPTSVKWPRRIGLGNSPGAQFDLAFERSGPQPSCPGPRGGGAKLDI
jgi:hypothetical protein